VSRRHLTRDRKKYQTTWEWDSEFQNDNSLALTKKKFHDFVEGLLNAPSVEQTIIMHPDAAKDYAEYNDFLKFGDLAASSEIWAGADALATAIMDSQTGEEYND